MVIYCRFNDNFTLELEMVIYCRFNDNFTLELAETELRILRLFNDIIVSIKYIKIRSTEEAVRGRQYGPCPSIQLEKRSFEGCIDGIGPY